jgi:hypothetical protein
MAHMWVHDEERVARIDQILEQLRLSTENLHELAKQAVDRAREANHAAEITVEKLRAEQAARQAAKNTGFQT